MISKDMAQVWVNVPKPLKRRLAALTKVDQREFSESRVTSRCIAAHLSKEEARARRFRKPTYEAPGRR